mmetsp:Transcript_20564/g.44991  ORF Transcript_20564/g.44991 Transcript_20564/m.44991 type:complete len:601 (-) Transcript_20564:135-1937(-)|eukprot:CAMPEP_0118931068 /NCGR_PEP_ID=MMETSP1169-20130426/7537_1 /TAXON_ID=36882 /ORGANISM="Pyramimonas obovata, Strain CCMP722" /LENGTH=600 /DNA_ID=CAMNT_0006873521 /DNA_START=263 /DNA_END=2065 /DNA_ORIENTATION=-
MELGASIAELRQEQLALREKVHERKVARKAALEKQKVPVVDVRSVLRLEESEYEHELKHKSVEGEDPRQPLRALITAILLETKGDFDPIDTQGLHRKLSAAGTEREYKAALEKAGLKDFEPVLVEMAEGPEPYIELEELTITNKTRLMVMDIHRPRLLSIAPTSMPGDLAKKGPMMPGPNQPPLPPGRPPPGTMRITPQGGPSAPKGDDLEALLSFPSAKERQDTEQGEELLELLGRQTTKEASTVERFKTKGGPALRSYCEHLTKEDCRRARNTPMACEGLHFVRIIQPHTDVSLGDCNYLDTCNHMRTCKRIHYELDQTLDGPMGMHPGMMGGPMGMHPRMMGGPMGMHPGMMPPPRPVPGYLQALGSPQWVNCDVRSFDYSTLGKFGVIMADPPWEIHMDLPYGIIKDDEMRQMDIACLQDSGVIFLWVTGRAMELGRELMERWGYKRVEELLWVKINQLQRIIRTGRTGHWLNHSKEHCLVGIKGSPSLNKMIDTDVLVAEVRETSRKPDEMYPLLERLSPGTRKLEIFGRQHNTQPGWITLGNQLDGTHLMEPELRKRFLARYPEKAGELTPPVDPSEQRALPSANNANTGDVDG